jgi:drug/metabolite transporter (DMT)-like permease
MTNRDEEPEVSPSLHAERIKLTRNQVVFGCAMSVAGLLLLVLNWGRWFELSEYRGLTLPEGLPGAVVVLGGVAFVVDGLRRRRALLRHR